MVQERGAMCHHTNTASIFISQLSLASRQKHHLSTLEAIVNEAQLIPVQLPNILSLQACLSRARAWVTDLEEIQVRII